MGHFVRNGNQTLLALLCVAAISGGLSACNSESNQEQPNDWVDDRIGAKPDPAPTATTAPDPNPDYDNLYTGPADLKKYVVKFVEDAKLQGVNVLGDMQNPKLEIQIASLDAWGASVIGLCETSGSRRRVTFDPDFWNGVSETQREVLAHHEFGHCILYRGHRSDVLASGAYASVMYPTIMSTSTYNGNYAYYQEELFTWGASSAGAVGAEQVHICGGE